MTTMHSLLGSGFRYETEILRRDGSLERSVEFNLLPQQSVDFVAGLLRGTAQPIANWYLFLFEGNYVPDKAFKAEDLQTLAVECVAYDEATRPAWTHGYDGTGVIDSLNNQAVFTFNAAKIIYGAGIISTSTKGNAAGTVLSIARFANPKEIDAGEPFRLAGGLTLIPTAF